MEDCPTAHVREDPIQPAPPHPQEAARLDTLAELDRLIRQGDARLDDLTLMAAEICGTPISVVSLVDYDQQYFVSRQGLDAASTPREQAFCAHAILDDRLFEVADATQDPRFAHNPLVTGAPDIRHYAGVPLQSTDGLPLGTLCVISPQPGVLDDRQRRMLGMLARQAEAIVNLHRAVRVLDEECNEQSATLARLVHDLRAPLKSLIQLTALAGDQPSGTELRTIRETARQLGSLADEILGDPARTADHPAEVDLRSLLSLQADQARPLLAQGVAIQTRVTARVPKTVQLRPVALRRMVTNLVHNAAKYTHHGQVTLFADAVADALRISVVDTGVGLSKHDQTRVFEPHQGANGVHRGGAGLGLTIVRELAEASGGTVSVHSAQGRGTAFTVELPLEVAVEAPPETHAVRVLVVDDAPINRIVATRILENAGYEALAAEDGLAALELMREQDVDVVLLDYWMPGPTGPDIARRIHTELGTRVQVLGWTGAEDNVANERFLTAGAAAVLAKPFDQSALDRFHRLVAGRPTRQSA